MSVYAVAEASPSRVLGVLRFVMAYAGQSPSRSTVEAMMAPPGLVPDRTEETPAEIDSEKGSGRALLQPAIKEAVRLGLLDENEKELTLGQSLNRKLIAQPRLWPLAVFELILDPKRGDHDLCRSLAWFLGQDIPTVPGGWNAMQSKNDILSALEMNVVSFGQMQHWAVYLGFGWRCGRAARSVFVFDPTAHLKLRLSQELGKKSRQFSAAEFLKRLAEWCPVLDGGLYRTELEEKHVLPKLAQSNVSQALSQALRRLSDEGWIEMSHASDAKAVILSSPDEPERVSKINWRGGPQS